MVLRQLSLRLHRELAMSDEYFELPHCIELGGENELRQTRSIAIREAIRSHRDFTFIKAAAFKFNDEIFGEIIYVDIECDEIPPNNPIGINFRERLAIFVPQNSLDLIEVYALRKTFPITVHQNMRVRGFPMSLCLYFEPPMSVARSWTAQKFLRRIQWWLEKSAKNELHPSDQPVENLFFITPFELILPWDFDQLRADNAVNFTVGRGEARHDGGITFFMEKTGANRLGQLTSYINIDLPPVVHGTVERPSQTLGELTDILAHRDIDLLQHIKDEIRKKVPQAGVIKSVDTDRTIIILHVPLCRTLGAAPDRFQHNAYALLQGVMSLGVELDFLYLLDDKYQNVEIQSSNKIWREIKTFPMDVRYRNDIEAFKSQSGTPNSDPKVALIGAGALGSAMLALWARAGWGHWFIVDKDHVKPHNLSRHIAYEQHVGESKANTVAELYGCIVGGARNITAINSDATELSSPEINEVLLSRDLVIDASTTLEYPRLASRVDGLPRHVSVFITPNGKSAVLMAEDEQRSIRLRTLEAQYYRAVIQQSWGSTHLEGNISTFWSGASCRDISIVLSNIHVTAHAAMLAGQCQQVSLSSDARISLWTHDHNSGAVAIHTVDVHSERVIETEGFTIYIDEGARQQLFELRRNALPNETGGALLGYYDFTINALVIVCGLSAPKDSVSSASSFDRGFEGLLEDVQEAQRRTAGVVDYIGEWHSHPDGFSVTPSSDDLGQVAYLTKKMAEDGLPAVQIIIGDNELSIILSSLLHVC